MPSLTPEQMQRVQDLRRSAAETRLKDEKESEELVQQIQSARKEVEDASLRLQELASTLRSKTRRNPEGSNGYLLFANAHIRLAGALHQGTRRTASVDRVIRIAQVEQEEVRRREAHEEQARKVQDNRRQIAKLSLPSEDAFDELYGEVVTDAE